jgi:hypothetical protein
MAVKEIAVSDAARVKARFLWSLLCIVSLLFYPFSFGTLLTFVSWKVLSTHWLLLSLYRKRLRGARRANLCEEFRKAAFAWGKYEIENLYLLRKIYFWYRGQSTTTWTECFYFFDPTPLPLHGQFLYPERGHKLSFFDPLPPSSCPRSYWMGP